MVLVCTTFIIETFEIGVEGQKEGLHPQHEIEYYLATSCLQLRKQKVPPMPWRENRDSGTRRGESAQQTISIYDDQSSCRHKLRFKLHKSDVTNSGGS